MQYACIDYLGGGASPEYGLIMTAISTAELILDAGIALLAESGPRAATVRNIAERGGVPPPTLQHHFPSKALLMGGIYAQAVDRHVRISEEGLVRFASLAETPELLPEIAIALLSEWRGRAAETTAVVLHMLAQAARLPAWSDVAREWVSRSTACIARAMSCSHDKAEFVVEILVGLALISAPRGFRLESDVLNRELIGFALAPTEQQEPGKWRRLFRAHLESSPAADSTTQDEWSSRTVVRAALDAGIRIMAESGAEALSYRSIAARAEVAPSSVLYNFPTRGALALAIYNEIHRRFATQASGQQLPVGGFGEQIVKLFVPMIVDEKAGDAPLVLASCELFLGAWWDGEIAEQAWMMRLTRGARSGDATAKDDFAAHFLSLWSIGLSLVQIARRHVDPRAAVTHRLRVGLTSAALAPLELGASDCGA